MQLQQGKYVLSLEGGWIKVVTHTHKIAELLKDMRAELDQILEEKIADPTIDLLEYPKGKLVISTIVNLITTE